MGYMQAKGVLPDELLSLVQQYVDGAYLYIPRRAEAKKGWGELKNTRQKLNERNSAITREYLSGRSVRDIAASYCLSDKAIYKVLSAHK